MKVFIDGDIFLYQKFGGISRAASEIIGGLSTKQDLGSFVYKSNFVDNSLLKRIYSFFDASLMNFLYKFNCDKETIYQSFFYRTPKKPKGPVVVFAYDMIQEIFGLSPKAINFKKNAFNKADLIIAISQCTKNDLLKLYPQINPEKVVVVYMGVSDIFCHAEKPDMVGQKPYFIYVGPRSYPYKNFNLLLDVFKENEFHKNFNLVLVGGEKLDENGHDWLLQKFCSDKELASLYKGAAALIYPSLYEGFGIPPIEAMASGCPVIASNISSMPEVIGNAGLLFDPKNKDDLTESMKKIISDGNLRQEMIKRGNDRAKQFTWQKTTDQIYNHYLKLLNQ